MGTKWSIHEAVDVDLWLALQSEDDGAAARTHLAAGRPIYYGDADTPCGLVIKEYSDGRKELVRFDQFGEHRVRKLDETAK